MDGITQLPSTREFKGFLIWVAVVVGKSEMAKYLITKIPLWLIQSNCVQMGFREYARQQCTGNILCANDLSVAELFPGAEVVAMDISPIQPVFAPPNLTLRLADIETDWIGHIPSDYVHLERVTPYLRRPKELLAKILT